MRVLAGAISTMLECTVTFLIDPETVVDPLARDPLINEVLCLPSDALACRCRAIETKCPALVIADIYDIAVEEAEIYKHEQSKLIIFDNTGPATSIADCVVNAIVGGVQNSCYMQGGTLFCVGPRYMIMHPDYRKMRPRYPTTGDSVGRIAVALGGADALDLTETVAEWLVALDYEVTLVKGPASNLDSGPVWTHHKVTKITSPDNLARVLSSCDLAVTGGGVSAYEAACLGVPAVIIPQAPHEVLTARRLSDCGSALVIGSPIRRNEFTEAVGMLARDRDRRRMMAWSGFRLLDGDITPVVDVVRQLID
jgi:spore coat polysaccharide biosynthesis predicted glycosyltransferase SpsG